MASIPTIPTISEIKANIIADYEAELGQSVPVLQKAFIRVLASVLSGLFFLIYRAILWLFKQISVQTAGPTRLAQIADQYGLSRIPATYARVVVSGTGTDSTVVPAAKLFTASNGLIYSVETQQTISSSAVSLTLACLTAGEAGNLSVSDELTQVVPLDGLDDPVTVSSVATTGADLEDLEVFRNRVRIRQQTPPQGGATPDYVLWAREVSGITAALAWRTNPGEVTVYCLSGSTFATRLPDSTKRTEVQTYLRDTARRPLNMGDSAILVGEFTEITFDVTISNLAPDTSALQTAIEDGINAYLLERFPRQYPVMNDPKDRITAMDIFAICRDAGAKAATVVVDISGGSSDIESYQLDQDELAAVGTVTFS